MKTLKKPKAHEVRNRPGLFAAKGINPMTGVRKNYYGKSSAEASELAFRSMSEGEDTTLFGFYANSYLPTVCMRSGNYLRQIAWVMEKHVLPKFGHRELDTITRKELQALFNDLETKLSGKSIRTVKSVFFAILKLAVTDREIVANPLETISLSYSPAPEKDTLASWELRLLIESSHNLIKPFVLLAGCCGLRRGEALGVKRSAIQSGVLRVQGQVEHLPGGAKFKTELKTRTSNRSIPMPAGLLAALECNQVSKEWIVSDTKGGFLFPKNVLRELHLACDRAKVRHVSPHELRHTFATILDSELEAPRSVVMALCGHSGKSMTDRYVHPKDEQLELWMNRLWDHVSTACNPKNWTTDTRKVG